MMGRTHVLLGLNSLWLLQPFASDSASLPLLAVAATLGALWPDLDAPNSLLQQGSIGGIRPFALPARAIAPFGHRGLLHSLLGLALAGGFALALGIAFAVGLAPPLVFPGWELWLAFVLGYASHLAGDACTRSGLRWLYPRPRRFHLLPRRLWLTTGSQAEEVVFAFAACGVLLLLLRQPSFLAL